MCQYLQYYLTMHQKQPPPRSAISVLFVFMELTGCAGAEKFIAPRVIKKQIILFILTVAAVCDRRPIERNKVATVIG